MFTRDKNYYFYNDYIFKFSNIVHVNIFRIFSISIDCPYMRLSNDAFHEKATLIIPI